MKLIAIASGSSGNCVYIGTEEAHILVDAGVSAKRIEDGLKSIGISLNQLDAIFVTHEHIDHVRGIEVLTKKASIPILGTKETLHTFFRTTKQTKALSDLFSFLLPGESYRIKDVTIECFSVSHDAVNPVGFCFSSKGRKIGMATDLGCYSQEIIARLSDANILYLEANYDENMLMVGSYPYSLKQRISGKRGHLSNDMSAKLLGQLLHPNLSHVMIAHMSKENNYAELAYETIRQEIYKNWCFDGSPPRVTIANRDIMTEPIDTDTDQERNKR